MSASSAEAQWTEDHSKSDHAESVKVPRKVSRWHDAALALSIAHLSLLQAAHGLLFDRFGGYFNLLPVNRASLAALLLNIVGLGLLLWFIGRFVRRMNSRAMSSVASLFVCASALIPLNFARTHFGNLDAARVAPLLKQPAFIIVAIAAALAAIWFHRRAARLIMAIYIILSPMVIFTVGKCGWWFVVPPPAAVDTLASASAPKPGPRIVWVVLDELDQRIAFHARPPDIPMPELTRLYEECFHATNAFPPGGATVYSVPALTIGREVRGVRELGPGELLFNGNTQWSESETVFSRTRSLGFATAVVGWLHPYGRVLGRHLERCIWYPYPPYEEERGRTVSEAVVNQLCSIFSQLQQRRLHLRNTLALQEAALETIRDFPSGLTLIHMPLPHTPGIYDAASGQFTLWKYSRSREYLENLALTDKLFGGLRREMERSGTWNNSWVILSSDHWWRESAHYDGTTDYRVPFIVKAPGKNEPATYDKRFNTLLTYHLILGILKGELTSASELPHFLDTYRTDPPGGYNARGEPL